MRVGAALLTAVLTVWPVAAAAQPPEPTLAVAIILRTDAPTVLEANGSPARSAAAAIADASDAFRALATSQTPFAISASPLWVDELIAAGQTRAYGSLLALAARHPLLLEPYPHIRLPDEPDGSTLRADVDRARAALARSLHAAPERILDPPGLVVTTSILDGVHDTGVSAVLAPGAAVGGRPVAARGVTLVPAEELVGPGAVALLLDRYAPNARIAAILRPTRSLGAVIGALAGEPRIRLVTITDVIQQPVPGDTDFAAVARPPVSYTHAVARAAADVNDLASYTLPGNAMAELAGILLERARSTADWQSDWPRGVARARAVADFAAAPRFLVTASDGSVTLTSKRGAVPVTLVNRARYPVRVRVRVTSPKLTFPGGDTKVVTISPHGLTITFVAEARSTGSFPMDVVLESPNGRVHFAGGRVVVRSTAANVLALALTLSGLLFLVGWSSRGFFRTRRTRR